MKLGALAKYIHKNSPAGAKRTVKAPGEELQPESEVNTDVPHDDGGEGVWWDCDGDELEGGEGISIG